MVKHRSGTVGIEAGCLVVVDEDWGRLEFPLSEVTVVESQFLGRTALTVGPEDRAPFTLRCCEPPDEARSLVAAIELAKAAATG